jgi:pimeloyl-ACP methyl ester carboxylesterase
MRMIWIILGVLAAVYGGLSLWLLIFQSSLVFYPETEREAVATPSQAGLPYEDLHLKTSDGVSLHGWYIPAAQPRGTVLFMHGNAGNISHRLDSIEIFHHLGYNTLIFDYRGYGTSGGKPTEGALIAMPRPHGAISPNSSTFLSVASCCSANRWAVPLPHGWLRATNRPHW